MVNCVSKVGHCFKTLIFTLIVFNPVWAEDIEIFFSQATNQESQPNVLFILDGSGSMAEYDEGSNTRLERLRSSLTSVLQNTTNINAGLMRFSHSQSGGSVIYPIRPIDQQLCNGQPCDDTTIFSAQSQVSSSADDAVEASNGAVTLEDQRLTLMKFPGVPTGASWVGLRFPNLQIPQGATITDARLDFTSPGDYDGYTNLKIFAEDTDNAELFNTNFNSISSRQRTNNSVSWNNVPEWFDDSNYESPNIATLVQQLVNKSSWCGGNAVAMIVNGDGPRLASAFDNGSADGPILRVEYKLADIPATGGCSSTTVIAKISGKNDDAEQRTTNSNWSNGKIYRNYNEVTIRKYPQYSNGYAPGLLFRDIAVPKNAVIKEANLVVTMANAQYNSGDLNIDIALENTGNASTISTGKYNLSNRSTISPAVTWTDMPTTIGATVVSPSLKNMTQSIVNRADWEEGNRMMVLLSPKNGSGQRSIASFDGSQANAASLRITFESNIRTAADQIDGPVTDVRSEIIQVLNDMLPEGGTPTVGALLEARSYFDGDDVNYGKFRYYNSSYTGSPHYWGRYGRVSHPETYTGGGVIRHSQCNNNALNASKCASETITGQPEYISPIENECQANHIVLLTDGIPTADAGAITQVTSLTGGSCDPQELDNGTCGEEIAQYLKSSSNNITTHTIGFNFTTQWLRDVASAGSGGYYTADTASQLTSALSNIINGVQDVNSTFVAPGVTVDRFSKLTHRNDLYLALFKPKTTPRWEGNMKRYELNGNPVTLFDKNDNAAMDGSTGAFKDSAQSYWSDSPDGNNVSMGGAAHKLDHTDRNVYTNVSGNTLTSIGNKFHKDNDELLESHFGLDQSESSRKDLLIDWSRGMDVDDEDNDDLYNDTRYHIGDPLHSQPQIVTYNGPAATPESVIFMGTNEGFLHAIDRDSGEELYSFVPKELLPNLEIFYDNNPAEKKPYGLDGPMSTYTLDANNNGIIESGDKVYLYIGMRRGGRNYYALDVSTKGTPSVLFEIKGGSSDFSELGQTWSKPVVAKIKYLGASRQVLIIAGGYDEDQDNHSTRTGDGVGRIIYIVDAEDGTILWTGGHADAQPDKTFPAMNYSIPSAVKVIDGDGDGHMEQFYTGDMGGQIWRFDIDPAASSKSNLISGGVIADLSEDGTGSSNRRFYHSPDISFTLKDGKYVLNIAIGSGYQAHPLNKIIDDRFYVIRYPYEFVNASSYGILADAVEGDESTVATYVPITESDLYNATDNVLGENTSIEEQNKLAASSGWLLEMERNGEKILGSSLTFDNVVMFTSYVPSAIASGCQPQLGTGIFWALNLWDATPVKNLDEIGDEDNLTKGDRNKVVPGSGLPASVQTYFVETSTTKEDGTIVKTLGITTSSGPHMMMEHDATSLVERIYWSEYPDY